MLSPYVRDVSDKYDKYVSLHQKFLGSSLEEVTVDDYSVRTIKANPKPL